MLQEYSTIAQSFFSLYTQLNETLRTYLTLMTAGAAAATFLLQILPKLYVVPASFNDLRLLGLLFVFLSFLGLAACLALIGLRTEMLLYARTINGVRRYFYSRSPHIRPFIVLPITSFKPDYYEGAPSPYFWQIILVGAVNSALAVGGLFLLSGWQVTDTITGSLFLVFVLLVVLHWVAYRLLCWQSDKGFPKGFGQHPPPSAGLGCEFVGKQNVPHDPTH